MIAPLCAAVERKRLPGATAMVRICNSFTKRANSGSNSAAAAGLHITTRGHPQAIFRAQKLKSYFTPIP